MAVRASAALRESDAVRHQPGHRVSVHGRCRRLGQRLGRNRGRDIADVAEADAAGRASRDSRTRRQFRNRRLRRSDDPAAAIRPQRRLGMDCAAAAASQAGDDPRCAAAAGAGQDENGPWRIARNEAGAKGIRRTRRRQRPDVRHSRGRNSRPHRPQWRGQEHDVRAHQRRAGAVGRRNPVLRRVDRRPAAVPDCAAWHRAHVSARAAVAADVGA